MAIIDTFHLDRADYRPESTLAELIAEERRAWREQTDVVAEADVLRFAWRKANPDLDNEDLPEEVIALDEKAAGLADAANAATDRVVGFVPSSLDDAIRLLDFGCKDDCFHGAEVAPSVLAGLRIIATSGGPATGPVTGDRRIFGLFREWLAAHREANGFPDGHADDDPSYVAACNRLSAIEDALLDCPPDTLIGVAVKFLVERAAGFEFWGPIGTDLARLAPDLAPLCAPALAEDPQS